MQIRQATPADMPGILAMGESFYRTTHYAGLTEFCPETVARLASLLMSDGVFLVAEDGQQLQGMVGLLVAPFMFNSSARAAYEVVYWVNPSARGGMTAVRLLSAIEPACLEAGCTAIQMVHMADSPPQAAALYTRLGYGHTESSWTKRIGNGSSDGGGGRDRGIGSDGSERGKGCGTVADERG
jgi:L-amino acid N-acyltransferase YncA